ncbi:hypothetical protein CONLIGDRAFT_561044, partial [Coniochaeta ligniaria NRRL 30616]
RFRPKYVYEPLRSPKHIRVMTILNYEPATYQVFARIDQVTLDQMAGQYTALSYTWGSPVEDFTKLRETAPPLVADSPHDIRLNIVPQEAFETFRRSDDFGAGRVMLDLYTTNVCTIPVQHNLSEWFKAYLDGWPQKQISKANGEPDMFEITVFWIDAICIDQGNKDEKAQQIPLMGEIYSLAARVLGWLGPNDTDLWALDWWHRAVYGRLQKFLEHDRKEGLRQLRAASFLDPSFWKDKFDLELAGSATWPACWVAYWAFYRTRKWFHRAWIVQEVVLASKLHLQCADVDLQWAEMAQFATIIGEAGWLDVLDMLARTMLEPEFVDKRTRGFGITDIHGLQRESDTWHILTHGWVQAWWAAIFAIRRRDCLMPEDKIYASLGILSKLLGGSDSVTIKVSATASAEEVYLAAAKMVMAETTGASPLALLSFVEPEFCRNLRELPSWIPDLTTSKYAEPLGGFATTFSAGVREKLPAEDEPLCIMTDDGELQLQGLRIDTIKTPFVYHGSMAEALCVTTLESIAALPEHYPHVLGGQDRVAAVCHTMTCHEAASIWRGSVEETMGMARDFKTWLLDGLGHIWAYDELQTGDPCPPTRGIENVPDGRRRATESLETIGDHGLLPSIAEVGARAEQIRAGWGSAAGPIAAADGHSSFKDQIQRTMGYRCLFSSSSGWLGVCLRTCEEGDKVWILERGAVPYVLRPLVGVGEEGTYKFMGECYVHGAMYGELM